MYYKVDGSNLRIAGTMHYFPAESPGLPTWLSDAYEWAEELVIESNSIPDELRFSDEPLSKHLSLPVWERLSSMWNDAHGPLEYLKPWAAFLSLPAALLPVVAGVESNLVRRANQEEKKVFWLESTEELAHLFDEVAAKVYAERIEFMVENPETVRRTLRELHDIWLSRSIPALLAFASALPIWGIPALRSAILLTRNRNWLPRFRDGVDSPRRTLFLVGALHLCGDGSLLDLLKGAGHSVTLLI